MKRIAAILCASMCACGCVLKIPIGENARYGYGIVGYELPRYFTSLDQMVPPTLGDK